MNEIEQVNKELELEEVVLTENQYANELTVVDAKSFNTGADYLRKLKDAMANVKEYFREPKELAHKAHKAIVTREKELLTPLQEAENIVRGKMNEFKRLEAQRLAEELRKKEEERKKAQEAVLAQAAKAEADGDESADALLDMATMYDDAPAPVMEKVKSEGVSTRKVWKIEVEDYDKIPKAVNGFPIMVLDESAVRKLIGLGVTEISGLKIYQEETIAIRRK